MKYQTNQKYVKTRFIHKVRLNVNAYKTTVHLERERKVYIPFLTIYELYFSSQLNLGIAGNSLISFFAKSMLDILLDM